MGYSTSTGFPTFSEGILRCKGSARAIDQLILQSEVGENSRLMGNSGMHGPVMIATERWVFLPVLNGQIWVITIFITPRRSGL